MSSNVADARHGPGLVARYRQARRDPTLAVIEGFHAVKHALRFGAEFICVHGAKNGTWRQLARSHAPDIGDQLNEMTEVLSDQTFPELAPQAPDTGLIALAKRPSVAPDFLGSSPNDAPLILLDHPAHGGNTGAVIRTAAAAGAAGVISFGPDDPWHPNVIRGSAGLHFALSVISTAKLPSFRRTLLAFDADGEPLRASFLEGGPVIALGSERRGLSIETRARADRILSLPMRQGVSSLNLAASAAIILYHWRLTQA